MTQAVQKAHEKFIAEQAAERLGCRWTFQDCEAPDFVVSDGAVRFGLELCRVFAGRDGPKGADAKREESHNQGLINALRRSYEQQAAGTPLSVQLLGCLCAEHRAAVVPAIMALNVSEQELGYSTCVCPLAACSLPLFAQVRRSIEGHAKWISAGDRVGWVDRDPAARIEKAVRDKASRLSNYRHHTGLTDQRILVYCDRTVNSGRLSLDPDSSIARFGFNAVYFFAYPEAVLVPPDRIDRDKL
ncbi:MAG: hypothetical protein OXF98_10240 [Rhodospirillaceae bacterium]|nr:hypothetical protein [Rhodospirillaceae bacterium]